VQRRNQVEALRREPVDQLASLARLSEAVAHATSEAEAYAAALDCLDETLSPDRGSVLLFDHDDVIRFRAWRGLSDAYRRFTEGHTPWTRETQDPEPVLVEDVAAEPSLAALAPVVQAEGIRSLGFFPLVVGGRLLGTFVVYFDEPHRFTPTEVRLAQTIGTLVALEIARRQAETELERHASLLDAPSECILVVSAAGRIVSFNRAFGELWGVPPGAPQDAVVAAITRLAGSPSFLDRLPAGDGRREELVLADMRVFDVHGAPLPDPDGGSAARVWFFQDVTERRRAEARAAFLARASQILGQSLDYRRTLQELAELAVGVLGDACTVHVEHDERFELVAKAGVAVAEDESALRRVAETGAPELAASGRALTLPLHARGRTIGAIVFAGGSYADAELELAADVARRTALAADNGLLHEAEQRARDAAERLQTVTEALARALTTSRIARTVVGEGAAALGAAAGWISVVDEERGELRRLAAVGYQPRLEAEYVSTPLERGRATTDAVLDERPFWFESAAAVAAAYPSLDENYRASGFEAMAVVPLAVAGRSTGAIVLNFREPRVFEPGERRLLVALAAQCGQALERAQLYAQVQERADAASVLAHVGDGVVQVDLDERVMLWNRGAARIMGIPAEEALGRRVGDLVRGWSELRERISITEEPVGVGRREALPVEVENRELWLAISGVATGDGVVYAFRDVTESEHLEKARRDFLSTVSHELRTPLAGVFGATKTLLHRHVEEDTRRALLRVIDSESERLARILDDILYASRLDEESIGFDLESWDVAALAREVIELEQTRVADGIVLAVDPPDRPPHALCDPVKLRQVLVNLVDNAIKYSPGGGAIEVAIAARERSVRLAVTDRGLGIPPGEQERIFEKFYRLDPELTRGVGGTGLGLYISREFVTRMGGRIWVSSAEGRGSTFFVELPAVASN